MSLAELLVQKAGQGADYSKQDVAGNIAKGAGLAMEAERLQQSRMQLEQQKKQVANQKMDKFVTAFQKGANYRGQARSKYYKQVLPKYRDALGLTDTFSDEALDFMTSDDTSIARVQSIIAKVRNGQMSEEDAIATINDPVSMAGIDPDYKESLYKDVAKASTTAINSETQRQTMAAQESRFNRGQAQARDFKVRGEMQALQTKRQQYAIPDLESSISDLDKQVVPGGIENWDGSDIPGVAGADSKLPINQLSAKGRKNRQIAQSLVNKLLKARSGGAVSDGEATRLLGELGYSAAIGEGGGWKALFVGAPSSQQFITGLQNTKKAIDKVNTEMRNAYGAEAYDRVVGPGYNSAPSQPKQKTTKPPKLDYTRVEQMAKGVYDNLISKYPSDQQAAIQDQAIQLMLKQGADMKDIIKAFGLPSNYKAGK